MSETRWRGFQYCNDRATPWIECHPVFWTGRTKSLQVKDNIYDTKSIWHSEWLNISSYYTYLKHLVKPGRCFLKPTLFKQIHATDHNTHTLQVKALDQNIVFSLGESLALNASTLCMRVPPAQSFFADGRGPGDKYIRVSTQIYYIKTISHPFNRATHTKNTPRIEASNGQ